MYRDAEGVYHRQFAGHYNPAEPREPGGQPTGGRWAADGGGAGAPPEAQRQVLASIEHEMVTDPAYRDKERKVVVSPQGKVVFSRWGERHKVRFDRGETAEWKGMISLHNHPQGVLETAATNPEGNSFSLPDIESAAITQLAEERVITSTGTVFTMRPPPGGWNAQWVDETLRPLYAKTEAAVVRARKRAVRAGKLSLWKVDTGVADEIWRKIADQTGLVYQKQLRAVAADQPQAYTSVVGARGLGFQQFAGRPDEPRIPAGQPGGGRWTSGGDADVVAGRLGTDPLGETAEARALIEPAAPGSRAAAVTVQAPAYRNQNSVAQAGAWLAAHLPGRTTVDFAGISPALMGDLATHIAAQAAEWPDVAKDIQYIGTFDGAAKRTFDLGGRQVTGADLAQQWATAKRRAYAYTFRDGSTIAINPDLYGDPARLARALIGDVEMDWHPAGATTAAAAVVHEFGHVLMFHALNHPGTEAAVRVDSFLALHDRGAYDPGDLPSGYARTSPAEAFAEGYAERYFVPPARWSPYTRDLDGLLAQLKTLPGAHAPAVAVPA